MPVNATQFVLGSLAWALSAILNAVLAYLCLQAIRTERSGLDLALWLFLFIFVTTLVTMVAGLLGLLTAGGLTLISLVGWITLFAVPPWRRAVTSVPSRLRIWAGRVVILWRELPTWIKAFSLALLVACSVRFGFLIWALPPFVWDSLTYHLTNVAHWVQVGRIEVWDTSMVRIYSPANYEVLAAWFTVFLHHDVVVEAAGLPAYALAIASLYALGRSLGITRQSAWLGALAYSVTPALLLPTTGTKNDPHMAAYYLLAVALLADLLFRQPADNKHPLRNVISVLLVLALAFGTKSYVMQLLPGLAVLVLMGLGLGGRGRQWRPLARRLWAEIRSTERSIKVALALLLIAGVFLGGYWNLRNWVDTGNPFFPYGVSLGGWEIWSGPQSQAGMGVGILVENLRLIAGKLGDRLAPIRQDLTDSTGWGWFIYVLGIPALAWALVRRKKIWPAAAAFAASLIFVLMATPPDPWNMRYIIWFPALFCLGFAMFWDALAGSWLWLRSSFVVIYVVTVCLSLASMVNYGQINPDEFAGMLDKPVWQRDAAVFHETVPQEYETALGIVPSEARLGYNVINNGFIYPLYRSDYSQRLVYIPVRPDETCQAIAGRMLGSGTRYLFVAPVHTPDRVISRLRSCADGGTYIRQRARSLYVLNDD